LVVLEQILHDLSVSFWLQNQWGFNPWILHPFWAIVLGMIKWYISFPILIQLSFHNTFIQVSLFSFELVWSCIFPRL
jgi:hypothetical protein